MRAYMQLGGFILSLVRIPQGYLTRTSDVNMSNFSVNITRHHINEILRQ